jgi:PAS domain S-box-containing protein
MIWVADHDQLCTYLSPGWLEFTGRTESDELGSGWLDGVHADDRPRLAEGLASAYVRRDRFRLEYRLRRWDGEFRWIRHDGEPRFDEGGVFVGYVAECADVTEQRRAKEALRQTNETLDALLIASSQPMARLDDAGRVTAWNHAAERLLGWSLDDLMGGPCRFVPAVELEIFRLNFESCLTGLPVSAVRMLWQRADGLLMNVAVSLSPHFGLDGEIDGAVVSAQNLDERAAESAALRDTAAALTSTLDPETVMQRILDNVGRVVPHDAGNIMQIDGPVARVTHQRGYPSALSERIGVAEFSLELPNYRKMLQTGSANLVGDTFTDPNWIIVEDFDWIRAHISIPIRVYDQIVGFLNLDSKQPQAFAAEDVERLQAFADQMAIAIENAQLYDALRRDADELKMLHRASSFLFRTNLLTTASLEDMARQFISVVSEEYEHAICAVYLIDDQRHSFTRLARENDPYVQPPMPHLIDGDGLIAVAVRAGKMIYAPDVRQDERYVDANPQTLSELVIPLRAGKEIIGALDLQSTALDAFGEHDLHSLSVFAERTAITLENVQLVGRIRHYTAELEERVTERTAELHRVKERVEAILNSSSEAILMVNDRGEIRQANRAFNSLFGYGIDAVFGQPLTVTVHASDQALLEQAIPRVINGRQIERLELTAITRDGKLFDAEVMMSPITEVDDRVLSLVCSLHDITARKRAEQELRNALESERELSELKTRFVTTASHEFRTPLAMIMTSSDILKTYFNKLTDEQRRARVDRIQTEVRNITRVLDDLLTLSRNDGDLTCQPVALDAKMLCQQVIADMLTQDLSNRRIDFETVGEPTIGHLDPQLIRRMLVNVISNALKFSRSESTITVTLTCAPNQKIFAVRDEGFGIPKPDQERLFQAFHRAKNAETISGTGLGLAIVKHAVEAHGGTITFTSELGVGTTFTITIPDGGMKEGNHE